MAKNPKTEDALARYLTAGGATVEMTEERDALIVHCLGCPLGLQRFYFDPTCTGDRMESFVTSQADRWAQDHAANCRALPRLTA